MQGRVSVRLGGGLAAIGWLLLTTSGGAQVAPAPDGRALLAGTSSEVRAGPLEYPVAATLEPVVVDGRLDDEAWARAVVIPLGFEVAPADNAPARVATECRIAHDRDHLYLGCEARDVDPGAIRAFIVDRDGIDEHDRIVLTLDPFNDQRRAFQFGVSALGVQSDAVFAQQGAGNPMEGPDAQPLDPSWDAIWSSAGTIGDDGYTVEAAIPFRSLRFPAGADRPWGAYLTRWWPRGANVQLRSAPLDRGDSCVLCQADLLTGIEGVTPGANVELTPTLTASRTDTRESFPAGPLVGGPSTGDVGFDARWGPTPNLTLNMTANPDFSQVEADVAQLDVNQQFALFFPERRPFFLEGADFFGTPIQAVFTRSISDPTAGAKLTGKAGNNAVGLLVAQDRINNLLIPGAQRSSTMSLDDEVVTAIARLRRDVGASSTVGALYTGREGRGYHNRVGGFDAFYRPVRALTVRAQALAAETEYPAEVQAMAGQPQGPLRGAALSVANRLTTASWQAHADFRAVTPRFRADAGFVTQSAVRWGSASVTRRLWGGTDRWFTQLRFTAGTWRNEDYDRNPLNAGMWFALQYEGPAQTSFGIWPNLFMRQHFAGTTHDGMTQIYFDASSAPTAQLSLGLNGNVGDAVDFANERLGYELRVSPRATVRVGRNTEATLQHTLQRLRFDGARVFTANLSQLRTVYNFSPRSFVRAVLQYRRTDRSREAYTAPVDARSEALLAQLLYAYKLNPQSVLYLGYGQDGDGTVDPNLRTTALTTRGRTFFFKLGYAWRP